MRIKLGVVVVALLIAQVVFAAPKFVSRDGIYTVPLNVWSKAVPVHSESESDAAKKVALAQGGQWTYCFDPVLEMQDDKPVIPQIRGSDFFLRYFDDRLAVISIGWQPLIKGYSLRQVFDAVNVALLTEESDKKLIPEGSIESETISGSPALGACYRVEGSNERRTHWVVRKTSKPSKSIFIRFIYEGAYNDPVGDFKKFRNGLVFKK